MIYKITIKMDVEDINEFQNMLDKYDMDYEINEVYESEE